jgi:glycosyltransferase involved in cell wall biosynthesis
VNLLYSAFIREASELKGVFKKVLAQSLTFNDHFDNVFIYLAKKSESVLYILKDNAPQLIKSFKYNTIPIYEGSNKIKRFFRYFPYNSFLNLLDNVIMNYNIDVLYYRLSLPTRKLMNIMKNKKLVKVVEIPTYPYEKEYKVSNRKFEYLFFVKNGYKKIFDLADIVVAVSGEKNPNVDEKFILINNGIQLDDVKIKKEKKKNYLNLLSIAHMGFWHGYDRIIKGLYEYYKTNPEKEIYYHCVGEGSDLENLKTLVRKLSLEKYVIFHGTKTGEDLDKVIDECDIALGSLGFHRTGLTGGSPLKAREYCARGIPFVIAYEDWDFPETFPFVYRIPKDDTPVDVSQVIKWYENLIKEHPNYSMDMRRYAEENLSWDAKMKPVIEKIKELAEEKERKQNI